MSVEAEVIHPNSAMAVREKITAPVRLTERDIDTLVAVGAIPKGCPPDVIEFFGKSCSEMQLSPFKRQIHLIKRWSNQGDRYTIQTGIDGYRARADRTGRYAGNDEYVFDNGLREYDMIQAGRMRPSTATSTVYKVVGNLRCPFTATARWDEYYPGEKQGFMWDKMPFLMLGKCAEALALRKAFPDELAGVYTDEEMAQADLKEVPKRPKPEPAPPGTGEDDLPFENAAQKPVAQSPGQNTQCPSKPASQAKPATTAAVIGATEEQRAKLIAQMDAEKDARWRATTYFIEITALLPNESLENLPLRFVPAMASQMRELGQRISDFHTTGKAHRCIWMAHDTILSGGTPRGPEASSGAAVQPRSPSPAATGAPAHVPRETTQPVNQSARKDPEWWRDVIITLPRKGMKRDQYLKAPDTIGSLYDLRHGNDEEAQAARQRLYGLVHSWEPKGWEKRDGTKMPPSAADLNCREALNAFWEFWERNHADEKL